MRTSEMRLYSRTKRTHNDLYFGFLGGVGGGGGQLGLMFP